MSLVLSLDRFSLYLSFDYEHRNPLPSDESVDGSVMKPEASLSALAQRRIRMCGAPLDQASNGRNMTRSAASMSVKCLVE